MQVVVSWFGILDPKKIPSPDSSEISTYGDDAVKTLLDHYGTDRPAETVLGDEVCMPAVISPDIHTEWKTFRQFLSKNERKYEVAVKRVGYKRNA